VRSDLKRESRLRRHRRVRKKVVGGPDRPRLAVYRSNRYIYAQLVDDTAGRTLAAASDQGTAGGQKSDRAKQVGKDLASKAKALGVERAVFDRGGRLYHGRVQAVAEGAREGGLQI
jgi:large subunit ribosomal protein L18